MSSGALMSSVLLLNLVRPDLTDMATKFEFVHNYICQMAGGERVSFNNSVFLSERSVADRNFAIAYFMSENGCFPDGVDIKKALDFHYQVKKTLLCNMGLTY